MQRSSDVETGCFITRLLQLHNSTRRLHWVKWFRFLSALITRLAQHFSVSAVKVPRMIVYNHIRLDHTRERLKIFHKSKYRQTQDIGVVQGGWQVTSLIFQDKLEFKCSQHHQAKVDPQGGPYRAKGDWSKNPAVGDWSGPGRRRGVTSKLTFQRNSGGMTHPRYKPPVHVANFLENVYALVSISHLLLSIRVDLCWSQLQISRHKKRTNFVD